MKLREEFKVYQRVFDNFTFKTLYKLARKYFDSLEGCISIGKEADVYRANKGNEYVAVKIYRMTAADFKNMWKYIRGDPRFDHVKMRHRDIVLAWTKKEFVNLTKADKVGVRVPKPIAFLNNVLIMEYIGGKNPAPTAKILPPKNPEKWYKVIMKYITLLYHKAKLVHSDLSEYNILNFRENPVIIDISQGVNLRHPNSEEFLKRDIKTIINWFKKLGLDVNFEDAYRGVLDGIFAST